jgi:acyl dehydratase
VPIDLDRALGAELPERSFSWTESDVLLYHLGIGFGSRKGDQLDPSTLSFTSEQGLQVLPSFGVVAPTFHETDPPRVSYPGIEIDLAQVVHASQAVEVHRPLPPRGAGTVRTTIVEVWDKRSAAVVVQEGVAVDDAGEPLFTTRSSIFARGEGGFGGERGPSTRLQLPEREPDLDTTYDVAPQQALLYRLCGDRNPLHSDPAFAERAGFPAPILHGLCSYGIVLREVVQGLLGSDATAVRSFAARFAGIVFPGETIRVRAWDEDKHIPVSATISSDDAQRDGAPVLADCLITQVRPRP